jgi:hypothetical protein
LTPSRDKCSNQSIPNLRSNQWVHVVLDGIDPFICSY